MPTELRTGAVVGGFRVLSVVGEGATGRVYLAEDERGRRVALKLLARDLARDERFRRRFLRETEIAAGLDHSHIVPTVASGEEKGVLYLALQYVEGSDLRELLRREGRLEPERALELVAQVAEALDAAHAAGLVHRDVKPGNILVTASEHGERAYLSDFGLARHVSSVGSLTGDRGFVGTVDYVAPEQIEGGPLDARADVYSLGCVLYECLAGEGPFDRESELAVVFAHLNEPPPRLSDVRPELPEAFDAVFARALAKRPHDRYATCGDLRDAARAALDGRRVPRDRRHLVVPALGVAAVALAATIGVVVTNERRASIAESRPQITQASIAGLTLGHTGRYYERRLGAARRLGRVIGPDLQYALTFEDSEVAVYFASASDPARIVTSWNRDYKTAKGVGPCSTVEELKRAYGNRLAPVRWAGTLPATEEQQSWAVGRNLLFSTHDRETIADVALYTGDPGFTEANSWRAWANYVTSVETPCS